VARYLRLYKQRKTITTPLNHYVEVEAYGTPGANSPLFLDR
jgi:hypothetical protein